MPDFHALWPWPFDSSYLALVLVQGDRDEAHDYLAGFISTWLGQDPETWLVPLHAPEEQDFYGTTLEEALAWCLVWLMAKGTPGDWGLGTPGDWGLRTGQPMGLDWGHALGIGSFLV